MESKIDCVVVGHNELSTRHRRMQLKFSSPPMQRQALRSLIPINGKLYTYLNALNHYRRSQCDGAYYSPFEMPSLAGIYLTSYLRKRGHSAEFVNSFQAEQDKLDELLVNYQPKVLAITTTLYFLQFNVTEIVQFVRKRSPETKIIVGGPYIWNLRAYEESEERFFSVLKSHGADVYVTDSQGEAALCQVVSAVKEGRSLYSIPNTLVWDREADKLYISSGPPEENNLDECSIDWTLFTKEQLGPYVSIRTARSCAFKCSFCEYPLRAGALSLASIETVEKELQQLANLGVRYLAFIDDTFNIPKARFKDLLRMMIRNKFNFKWISYFRAANAPEDEIYDLMKEAGCWGVFLGIESGDPSILKRMNKAASIHLYEKGIRRLAERGIVTYGSFIIGFPGETEETVANTTNFIERNQIDFYRAEPWFCSPTQPIYKKACIEFGLEGSAYTWRHDTMNSETAADHCDRLFREIQSSISLPDTDFGFWSIPYLISKGMTYSQIRDFLRGGLELITANLDSPRPHAGQNAVEARFQRLTNAMSLREPKYRLPKRDLAEIAMSGLGHFNSDQHRRTA